MDKDHKNALLVNLTKSLILHGSIQTTLHKAKKLRGFAEKIINKAKPGGNELHKRRLVLKKLQQDNNIVRRLFGPIKDSIKDRNGGYLRILKSGYRHGDAAPMGIIQFVDTIAK